MNNFPCANIHEMLIPDILYQLIKGTFKDPLVTWVGDYFILQHGKSQANEILDDRDHCIAAAPPYPGLQLVGGLNNGQGMTQRH